VVFQHCGIQPYISREVSDVINGVTDGCAFPRVAVHSLLNKLPVTGRLAPSHPPRPILPTSIPHQER